MQLIGTDYVDVGIENITVRLKVFDPLFKKIKFRSRVLIKIKAGTGDIEEVIINPTVQQILSAS